MEETMMNTTLTGPTRSGTMRTAMLALCGTALTTLLVWSLGTWQVSASLEKGESTIIPVVPARILDTRDPVDLGLAGPFVSPVSQDLQVTGKVATAEGMRTVVPAGATGVVLNVTAVQPTGAGFISVRPSGTPGAPTTSNLNFEAGDIVPNAVSVQLPTSGPSAGKIQLTYDAFGVPGPITDILVDVVAYTSSLGIADLAARVSALEAGLAGANGKVVHLETKTVDANKEIATLKAHLATKQDACADGTVIAWGRTIATPGTEWVQFSDTSCTGTPLQIREVNPGGSPGLYEIRMDGYVIDPTSIQLSSAGEAPPRTAGYVGNGLGSTISIQVWNTANGDAVTGSFQVAVHSVVPAS
jgi:hypothetical protein